MIEGYEKVVRGGPRRLCRMVTCGGVLHALFASASVSSRKRISGCTNVYGLYSEEERGVNCVFIRVASLRLETLVTYLIQ